MAIFPTNGFGPNMAIFPIFVYAIYAKKNVFYAIQERKNAILGNIEQQNVFYDILEREQAFCCYKNKRFKK